MGAKTASSSEWIRVLADYELIFSEGVRLIRCPASYQPNVPQMSAVAIGVFNQSRGSNLKGKLTSTTGATY